MLFRSLRFTIPAPGRLCITCASQENHQLPPHSPQHRGHGREGLTPPDPSLALTLSTGHWLGSLRISAPLRRRHQPSGWSGSAAGQSSTEGKRGQCQLTQPFAGPRCPHPQLTQVQRSGGWGRALEFRHPQSPYREFKINLEPETGPGHGYQRCLCSLDKTEPPQDSPCICQKQKVTCPRSPQEGRARWGSSWCEGNTAAAGHSPQT